MIHRLAALVTILGLCLSNAACVGLPASAEEPLPEVVRSHPDSFVVVTVRNNTPSLAARAGSTLRGYDSASGYTVGSGARSAVDALASAHHLREVSSWPIASLGIHCVVFELPANETAAGMIAQLRRDFRVESAQPLQAFATQGSDHQGSSYNDPYRDLQRSLAAMNVIPAHRWSRGAGVRIAVIDTGVDTAHPDLAGRIAGKRNFVDADERAFAHDRHGTAVAGVIAADSNNQIGIVGVAPEARLYAYKACWQQNAGAVCNTFTLAKALAAAIEARVQIVNLSLAGPQDALLTRLVARGQQRGIIFVGATLPETATTQNVAAFPSGISGVLKVAAIEHHRAERGTLLAPGAEVLTLVPEGRYDFISGNSLATANVAGTVALLIARDRDMSIDRLQNLLTTTAQRVAATDATESGVNACAALAALLNKAPCPAAEALSVAAE